MALDANKREGRLLVCATPIGNLGDVTLRVLDALRDADLIAAEDTRRTRKLLTRYGLSTPLVSYHARNEKERAPKLLDRLRAGDVIALVSDAGTPGISDPGHRLIRACVDGGVDLEVLPGPNAALAGLVVSGLPTDAFTFAGFPPRRSGARLRFFADLVAGGRTFVFYESPHRIVASVGDLAGACGDCRVAVVRELTKLHEEIVRGTARDVAGQLAERKPRGEYVVVVSPRGSAADVDRPQPSAELIASEVARVELDGTDRKEAMRIVAKQLGLARGAVYDAVVGRK